MENKQNSNCVFCKKFCNFCKKSLKVKQMRTHYDVLNLEKNCSAKEIKESFIKLSKKYHPDKNKDSDAHKRFVEVNEAYSVLGKPSARCSYDATLSRPMAQRVHCSTGYNTRTPYEQYSKMYANNIKRGGTGGYYNKKKLGAVLFCCLLMVFGSGLQLIAESRKRAARSQEIAKFLRETKGRYSKMGGKQILMEIEKAAGKKDLKRVKKEP